MQQPQAIIFDLDGVLTDTSEYHYRAWKRLADDEGIPFTREENHAHLRDIGRHRALTCVILSHTQTADHTHHMQHRDDRYYDDKLQIKTPNDLIPTAAV